MYHSFDTDVAEIVGINAAIIFNHIVFWCKHNEANGENFYDGRYWTYNKRKALAALFPYMSIKQIDLAIHKLIDADLLMTGKYNELKYDHTLWYALTERGEMILQNGDLIDTETGATKTTKGGLCNNPKVVCNTRYIPDILPDNKEVNAATRRFTPPSLEEVENYCAERNNGIDAQQFLDFYASKGWKVGNQPMKDWRAAVRTWEKRDGNRAATRSDNTTASGYQSQRTLLTPTRRK